MELKHENKNSEHGHKSSEKWGPKLSTFIKSDNLKNKKQKSSRVFEIICRHSNQLLKRAHIHLTETIVQ
jgi:hypothetical protein